MTTDCKGTTRHEQLNEQTGCEMDDAVIDAVGFISIPSLPDSPLCPPTHSPPAALENISYGTHERQVLDLWLADRTAPAPLVVFIHGGGFVDGDKTEAARLGVIEACLRRGVSFAAINYRYLSHAPVQSILDDTARAIRFLRHRATEWNIDTDRIGAFGDSAGAGASLWLAFGADPGDPTSDDEILRCSSRLTCCAGSRTQSTYDLREWCAIVGEHPEGRTAESNFDMYWLESASAYDEPETDRMLNGLSMLKLIDATAPPVMLLTTDDLGPATHESDYLHHPKHAHAIQKQCEPAGVDCTLGLIGEHPVSPAMAQVEFLMERLGAGP